MKKVLCFTATWCKPCQELKPILEKITSIDIEYVFDTDDRINLYNITSVPTLVLMENDVEIKRHRGKISEEDFNMFIV
jgi:thiol-disulfide isomerase/thioredoxin